MAVEATGIHRPGILALNSAAISRIVRIPIMILTGEIGQPFPFIRQLLAVLIIDSRLRLGSLP